MYNSCSMLFKQPVYKTNVQPSLTYNTRLLQSRNPMHETAIGWLCIYSTVVAEVGSGPNCGRGEAEGCC